MGISSAGHWRYYVSAITPVKEMTSHHRLDRWLPDRTFYNFTAFIIGDRRIFCNVVRRICKLQNCERAGRVYIYCFNSCVLHHAALLAGKAMTSANPDPTFHILRASNRRSSHSSETILRLRPYWTLHNFRASRSGDRRILCSSGTSYSGFLSSKAVKWSVGKNVKRPVGMHCMVITRDRIFRWKPYKLIFHLFWHFWGKKFFLPFLAKNHFFCWIWGKFWWFPPKTGRNCIWHWSKKICFCCS